MIDISVILAVQLFFFCILLYTFFRVSITGKVTIVTKWMLSISSIMILGLADKLKLIGWIAAVGIIYLIKYVTLKKQKNGWTA